MNTVYIIMNVIMYGAIIGIMTMLPYLTRKNLVFGVSVPAQASDLNEIKEYRSRYVKLNLLVGFLLAVVVIVSHIMSNVNTATLISTICLLVYLGLVYSLYLQTHKKVKSLKASKGWAKEAKDIRVVDTRMMMESPSVTPLWFTAHIVTIVLTSLALTMNYDKVADMIPMQMDMAGNVSRYAAKTPMTMMFPVLMQITMLVVFVVVYLIIDKVPPYIDPDQPELGKIQAKVHKKAWTRYALITGYMMVALFAVTAMSMIGWVSMAVSGVITVALVILLLLYTIILAVKLGQSGNRVKAVAVKGNIINREDDRYWKAGIFYVNNADPSYFVEKRFGVGFTLNFGRPMAVIVLVLLIAFVIGMSFLATLAV